ncbi:MAG: hypothetical protein OXE92_09370, partial [Bacteroidetes bacterium]|nr:hypothetical protein [Bacteroidota bacterium]MCY4205918.1 hypothetical protein [Bacteroidota bacterium]
NQGAPRIHPMCEFALSDLVPCQNKENSIAEIHEIIVARFAPPCGVPQISSECESFQESAEKELPARLSDILCSFRMDTMESL